MLRRGATTLADRLEQTTHWRLLVVAVAAGAFLARLAIITHSHGGADLQNYVYFSRIALHGHNPFTPPANGFLPPRLANSPPAEFAMFAGLLAIHDSPQTLRLTFAVADSCTIGVIGMLYPRSRPWRLAMIVFYGFNPFVLLAWTLFAEDKTILFLGIVLLFVGLERGWAWRTWLCTSALMAFKFLGAFAAPALALDAWRSRRLRALAPIAVFVAICMLSNLPWFPQSLKAFSRRDLRLSTDPPIHASPTLLLYKIGIYGTFEPMLLSVVAVLLVIHALHRRSIDVREATAWSLFVGYVFLPDDAFDRIVLITLPFLLLLNPSIRRWVLLWVLTSFEALAGDVAVHGVPHSLHTVGGLLRALFSHEGTVRHVLWMNAFPALVLSFYWIERHQPEFRRRRALVGAHRPAESMSA